VLGRPVQRLPMTPERVWEAGRGPGGGPGGRVDA
jgi:hypothetical protein